MEEELLVDRGPAAFAVTTATLVLSFAFVAARVGCRIGLVRRVGWDDYCVMLAWLLALGLGVAIAVATRHGLGWHDGDIAPSNRGVLHRCEYVFSVLYNPALMATKTAILVFYLRLSRNTQPLLRFGSFAVLAVVNVSGAVLTLINIFQCRPIAAGFVDNSDARCIPLLTEFICSAPVNVVTDLAILALPLPVLTGMRLPLRQKTILVLTFGLGIFVTVIDVVRIYYLQQAIGSAVVAGGSAASSADLGVGFGEDAEFAWNAAFAFMWSAVEVNVGIICACIPTLKPLVIHILPAILMDGNRSGGSGSGSYGSNNKPCGRAQAISSPGLPQPQQFLTFTPADVVDPSAQGGNHHTARNHQHNRYRPRLPRRITSSSKVTYFGFINIKRPKNMLEVSAGASLRYCTTVAVLFFLWGFSYGLLNSLNDAVAAVANMTVTQTLGLTSAYFGGGYLFGPLMVGGWVLRRDEHHRREYAAVGRVVKAVKAVTAVHRHHHHHAAAHPGPSSTEDSVGGFKATFIVGLSVYGVGTIMFWPSAVLASFPGFLISNFVAGFGLSILETAANPFLVLCGPPAYAEMRLLLAQGAQGVASVLSGLLAQNVFFDSSTTMMTTTAAIRDVQWTYLAVTLLCSALGLFFYYMPLPEVRDVDLARALARDRRRQMGAPGEGTAHGATVAGQGRSWWRRWWPLEVRTVCLLLAVFAQWTNSAAQESMSVYFHPLLVSWLPPSTTEKEAAATSVLSSSAVLRSMTGSDLTPNAATSNDPAGLVMSVPNALLLCRSLFAAARFGAAGLVYVGVRWRRPSPPWWFLFLPTSPRAILLWSTALTTLFRLLLVALPPQDNPNLLLVPLALFFVAQGPIWPLVFALGLRGQGTRTKRAAAYITVGASGPLFWPFVLYAIMTRWTASVSALAAPQQRSGTQMAFIVVVVLAVGTMVYPLYLTLSRGGRQMSRLVVTASADEAAKEGADVEAAVVVDPADGRDGDNNGAQPATASTDIASNSRDAPGAVTMPGELNIYPGQ